LAQSRGNQHLVPLILGSLPNNEKSAFSYDIRNEMLLYSIASFFVVINALITEVASKYAKTERNISDVVFLL